MYYLGEFHCRRCGGVADPAVLNAGGCYCEECASRKATARNTEKTERNDTPSVKFIIVTTKNNEKHRKFSMYGKNKLLISRAGPCIGL